MPAATERKIELRSLLDKLKQVEDRGDYLTQSGPRPAARCEDAVSTTDRQLERATDDQPGPAISRHNRLTRKRPATRSARGGGGTSRRLGRDVRRPVRSVRRHRGRSKPRLRHSTRSGTSVAASAGIRHARQFRACRVRVRCGRPEPLPSCCGSPTANRRLHRSTGRKRTVRAAEFPRGAVPILATCVALELLREEPSSTFPGCHDRPGRYRDSEQLAPTIRPPSVVLPSPRASRLARA